MSCLSLPSLLASRELWHGEAKQPVAKLRLPRTQAFRAVVQDDALTLQRVLAYVPQDIWTPWAMAGQGWQDLLTLSEERGDGHDIKEYMFC